ncbi:MAG: tRNA preQ1(34) S-adenosylmethionine ribosyltransferase-isomerase QueA [Bacillota bacterium]|nr:MAG: tRNA preQ1(34) S-adenosylmethionine ribosyltransferase-isomerase QueA [Bacillota bacterium]
MRTEDFDYDLPRELIAQEPATPRDSSRLMVLLPGRAAEPAREEGAAGTAAGAGPAIEHRHFRDLPDYLHAGDLIVFNRTRVIRARLIGRKAGTGGKVEVLLLRPATPGGTPGRADWVEGWEWEVLVRPGRRVRPGVELTFGDDPGAPGLMGEVRSRTASGGRVISFRPSKPGADFQGTLEELGQMPLPPYITRPLGDPERYQTVYARERGSAAAPTAGLHFTHRVLKALRDAGVESAEIILHIGLDTFRPVREGRVEAHRMHREWYEVPAETAAAVSACRERGGRVVACGTTVVRALESAADPAFLGRVRPVAGDTGLFIYPGYRFRVVDILLTNFHLPRSTLLMLVSAFGGRERVLASYEEAARLGYRFYSFGDAMLVFPERQRGESGGGA